MGIIKEASIDVVDSESRIGPRSERTRAAQEAVDEFIESGFAACEVDWQSIDSNFDVAKSTLSSRLPWTRHYMNVGHGVRLRSNRKDKKLYLVNEECSQE